MSTQEPDGTDALHVITLFDDSTLEVLPAWNDQNECSAPDCHNLVDRRNDLRLNGVAMREANYHRTVEFEFCSLECAHELTNLGLLHNEDVPDGYEFESILIPPEPIHATATISDPEFAEITALGMTFDVVGERLMSQLSLLHEDRGGFANPDGVLDYSITFGHL